MINIKNPNSKFEFEKESFRNFLLNMNVDKAKKRLGLQHFNWMFSHNTLQMENVESLLLPVNMPEYSLSKEDQKNIDDYTHFQQVIKKVLTAKDYLLAYQLYEQLDEKIDHWKIKYKLVFCLTRLKEYKRAFNSIDLLIKEVEENKHLVDNQWNQIDFDLEKQDKVSRVEPLTMMNSKKVLGDCWCQKANIAHFLKYDADKILEYYEKAKSYNPTDPVINMNLLKCNSANKNYAKATTIFKTNKQNNTFFDLCKQTSKVDNDLQWLMINEPEFQILNQ